MFRLATALLLVRCSEVYTPLPKDESPPLVLPCFSREEPLSAQRERALKKRLNKKPVSKAEKKPVSKALAQAKRLRNMATQTHSKASFASLLHIFEPMA